MEEDLQHVVDENNHIEAMEVDGMVVEEVVEESEVDTPHLPEVRRTIDFDREVCLCLLLLQETYCKRESYKSY